MMETEREETMMGVIGKNETRAKLRE